MADEFEDDTLELDDALTVDEPEDDGSDAHEPVDDDGDDDEEVASFGNDDLAETAPTDLVKHLRQQIRERDRQIAASRKSPQAEQPIEIGARPTMEACEYDQERFDGELDAWDARREAKRQQDANAEHAKRDADAQWETVKANYATKRAALKFTDKDQVEAAAFEALSATQQAVIAKVATDPALLIYAVGKNAAKLDQLAAIDDPLVLAAAVGRMGATLTIKKRARAPDPEQIVRGGTVRSGDKALAKLEAEAERTGDYSKVVSYGYNKDKK